MSEQELGNSHPGPLVWAAVPAAGTGVRMGADVPKQYLSLAGKRIAEHTLEALLAVRRIRAICVAIAPGDGFWSGLPAGLRTRVHVVEGGSTRAESVMNALRGFPGMPHPDDWVLVHDMARPCVRPERIAAMIDELAGDPVGGLLALPLADTLKRAGGDQRVAETLPREGLWRAQTPQLFRFGLLTRALREALATGIEITDEAMAVEQLGLRPRLLAGSEDNIKITHMDDLALAQYHLTRHGSAR